MSVILASKSPRRKELLGLLRIPFEIRVADIDESFNPDSSPETEVANVSLRKAKAVADLCNGDDVIISADTVVVLGNEIMGKPKSKDDAVKMLKALSGGYHTVMTGVSVVKGKKSLSTTVKTNIKFRDLSLDEINFYVETGEPMDKAGAYGIQGGASIFVEKIDGDYFNVVGLPICTLTLMLREMGVDIFKQIINKP